MFCLVLKVLGYAVYLYDAVHLYALALNKTFANHQDPRNGTAVFNNMIRTEFESKSNLWRTDLVTVLFIEYNHASKIERDIF